MKKCISNIKKKDSSVFVLLIKLLSVPFITDTLYRKNHLIMRTRLWKNHICINSNHRQFYGNSLNINVCKNWAEGQRTFGTFAAVAPMMGHKPAEISLISDSVRCVFKSLS